MEKIPRYGGEGTSVLMELALNDNPIIREFSIQLLGEQHYLPAEPLYLSALNDSVKRVRSSAIQACGVLTSERAADSLIRLLTEPKYPNNLFLVYGALGSVGQTRAIPYLAEGLVDQPWYNQQAALNAIMELDPEHGVEYAIRELKDPEAGVRQNAVMQCILSEDPRVIEPLAELYRDDDFEVRFYARQGVKRLQARSANGPPGTR
jgi:HEAT repeat protein